MLYRSLEQLGCKTGANANQAGKHQQRLEEPAKSAAGEGDSNDHAPGDFIPVGLPKVS